ncbi:MAG: S-layer homology domain-containing protein [Oscillospiraceae bacterium]|nr:S-layer homology domain-containing protein [Oscillospiraceae bacterium]
MRRRILSAFLAFCMALTLLPTALATEANGTIDLTSGYHEKWIDRLVLPDYAKTLYDVLEEAADGDGDRDYLIDDTYIDLSTGVVQLTGSAQLDQLKPGDFVKIYTGQNTICGFYFTKVPADASELTNQYIQWSHHSVWCAFDREHPEVFWRGNFGMSFWIWYDGGMRYYFSLLSRVKEESEQAVATYSGDSFETGEYMFETGYHAPQVQTLSDDDSVFTIRNTDEDGNLYTEKSIKATIAERDQIVKSLTDPLQGKSRYEQVKGLNSWLTQHNEYNSVVADPDPETGNAGASQTAWECISALRGRSGPIGPVCAGYAKAFQVLARALDIPCVQTLGDAGSGDDRGYHMWNYVQMDDGLWYAVDVTWNDPTNSNNGNGNENYLLIYNDKIVNNNTKQTFIDEHPATNTITYWWNSESTKLDVNNGPEEGPNTAKGAYVLPFDGSVTVSGTPELNQTLTAVVSGAPADAGITYQWLRNGTEIPGAAQNTYAVQTDDLGAEIAVRVTVAGYQPKTSEAVKIAAERISITAEADARVYNGTDTVPAFTVKIEGTDTVLTAGTDYTVAVAEGTNTTDAGVVQVTVVPAVDGRYTWTPKTVTYTISKADKTSPTISKSIRLAGTSVDLSGDLEKGTYGNITVVSGDSSLTGTPSLSSGGVLNLALSDTAAEGDVIAVTCTVTPDDSNYNPYTQRIEITLRNLESQTISITGGTSVTYGGTLTLRAEGGMTDSPIAWTVDDDTIATVSPAAGSVTVLTPLRAGTVTVTAVKAGDDTYAEATASTTVTISRAGQSLNITSRNYVSYGDTLTLTADSGGVTWTVANGTGEAEIINGNVLNPIKTGTVTVTAELAADEGHEAASDTMEITIRPMQYDLSVPSGSDFSITDRDPDNFTLTVTNRGVTFADLLALFDNPGGLYYANGDPIVLSDVIDINDTYRLEWRNDTGTQALSFTLRPEEDDGETYYISIPKTGNGDVIPNTRHAESGSRVSLSVHPDKGYELDSLTVTDVRGREVSLRYADGDSCSFIMPPARVTVEAVFTPVQDNSSTSSDDIFNQPFTGLGTPGISGIVLNPSPLPFVDVQSKDWFYNNTDYVWKHYLMSGVSDTAFAPQTTTTRAMVWTIIARMHNVRTDINPGATWYERGMLWAVEHGITDGSSPMDPIIREELAVELWRSAGCPAGYAAEVSRFADSASVSDYARSALGWAVSAGIMNGSNGNLNPQGTATRAEIAAMVSRYGERVG